ncbi:hypothetical protein PVAG01_01384 [Phlyctema vagabunda]|uniref:Uncharacterized protein n=1 Tax=Phlyctema vagabunda TaxID=108571 RepID=A0ABR4PWY2_9HELO
MQKITTSIEIAAPPSVVRAKLLEFPLPIALIQRVRVPSGKACADLQPGERVEIEFRVSASRTTTMTMSPVVRTNGAASFSWVAGIRFVFQSEHIFRFEPVAATSGAGEATRFVHEETFTGLWASVLMGHHVVARLLGQRKPLEDGFVVFNDRFRALVEGR